MDVLPGIFGRRIIGPHIVFGPMIQVSDLAPAFPENRMPPFRPLLQVDIPSSALELVDSGRAVDVLAAMADMPATTTAIRGRAGGAGSHGGCRCFPRPGHCRRCSGSGCSRNRHRRRHNRLGHIAVRNRREEVRGEVRYDIRRQSPDVPPARCSAGSHSGHKSTAYRRRFEGRYNLPPCTAAEPR